MGDLMIKGIDMGFNYMTLGEYHQHLRRHLSFTDTIFSFSKAQNGLLCHWVYYKLNNDEWEI